MTDIVEKLRDYAKDWRDRAYSEKPVLSAADEIERLRADLRTTVQALRDIAGSECIPTPEQAWKFCRDTAAAGLPKD